MRKNEDTGFSLKRCVTQSSLGAVIAFVLCLLALLGVASFILSGSIGEDSMGIAVSAVLFVCSLIGGIIAYRRGAGAVLVAGPVVGLILYLLLCIVRMIFYGQLFPSEGGLANFVAAIAGGCLGALVSGKKRGKRKRSRKHS